MTMKFIGSELIIIFWCKRGSKILSGSEYILEGKKTNGKVISVHFFRVRFWRDGLTLVLM